MTKIPSKTLFKEILMMLLAFWLVFWGILGEYFFGIYKWQDFILLLIIPCFVLGRFTNLDSDSYTLNKPKFHSSFEKIPFMIVIIITILSLPYLCVISGILPQDTFLSYIFVGNFGHGGIHHGWVGSVLVWESYIYHRINRHAKKLKNAGILLRNGFFITGIYLFCDDFWYEEVIRRFPTLPDVFSQLNQLLPLLYTMNLILIVGMISNITIIGHIIYYIFYRKSAHFERKSTLNSPLLN